MNIFDAVRRLSRLDLASVRQAALADAAATMADAVRATSHAPGIGVTADADQAVIGSSSKIAIEQERGTATTPPRPVFSAITAEHAEAAAAAIGAAVARAIRSA